MRHRENHACSANATDFFNSLLDQIDQQNLPFSASFPSIQSAKAAKAGQDPTGVDRAAAVTVDVVEI
jgi:hypothetical protein